MRDTPLGRKKACTPFEPVERDRRSEHDRDGCPRACGSPVPRRRPGACRVRAQGDHDGRARDARPDVVAARVRRGAAAARRPDLGLAAHDDPDGGVDRDARRARRRDPLGVLQHLLDPGSCGGRSGRRPHGVGGRAGRRARVRLEGRDARGVLVVRRAGHAVARRRPEHAARRRRRHHAARAQGRRVREGRRGARPGRGRLGGVPYRARAPPALARGGRRAVDTDRCRDQGRQRGDDDRRPSALPDGRGRPASVPRDQRQRLGDEEQVRQPLRLPPLARRRDQPGGRPDARRQAVRRLRLRRRRQGLGRVAARRRAPAWS